MVRLLEHLIYLLALALVATYNVGAWVLTIQYLGGL